MRVEVCVEYPAEAVSHYNRGCDMLKSKQTNAARGEFELALQQSPTFVEALINMGNCLRSMSREADAVTYYIRAIHLEPDNPLAHFNYGLALYELNQFKEAVDELDHAARIEPGDHQTHYMLACYCATVRMPLKALRHAKTALLLRPLDPQCYSSLCYVTLLILCNTVIDKKSTRH